MSLLGTIAGMVFGGAVVQDKFVSSWKNIDKKQKAKELGKLTYYDVRGKEHLVENDRLCRTIVENKKTYIVDAKRPSKILYDMYYIELKKREEQAIKEGKTGIIGDRLDKVFLGYSKFIDEYYLCKDLTQEKHLYGLYVTNQNDPKFNMNTRYHEGVRFRPPLKGEKLAYFYFENPRWYQDWRKRDDIVYKQISRAEFVKYGGEYFINDEIQDGRDRYERIEKGEIPY